MGQPMFSASRSFYIRVERNTTYIAAFPTESAKAVLGHGIGTISFSAMPYLRRRKQPIGPIGWNRIISGVHRPM
jgi:hypothetical protein